MKYEKSCGVVVYKKDYNQLLFLIIKSKAFNFYSFPKGHVEANETELETALRELKEETNINAEIFEGFRHVIEYSPSINTLKTVVYFLGEAINDTVEVQIEEVSEAIWLTFNEAYQTITYDNEKQVLKAAYEFLIKHFERK